MASVTTLKFPDGRTESRKVLSFFVKNNESVLVLETEKLENGNKVVGLSYLVDGFFQNIVDESKWSEIKSNLVAILKDQIGNEDYRVVPSEILVTADPYRQLALRDANLDKIIASYEAFLSTQPQGGGDNINSVSQDITNINMESPVESENVNTDFQQTSVSENPIEPNPVINSEPVNTITEINNSNNEINDVPDIPILGNMNSDPINDSVEEPVVNDVPSEMPNEEVVSQEIPEIGEARALGVQPIAENEMATNSQPVIQDIVPPTEAPNINNFVNETPVIEDSSLNQDSVLENVDSQISIEENNENSSSSLDIFNNGPVISEEPIIDSNVTNLEPEAQFVEQSLESENNSVVQNAYLDNVEKIKEEINQITNGYIENIKKLSDAYMKDIDDKKMQIKGILEEAKGINALSKETFDKAQAISNSDNQA